MIQATTPTITLTITNAGELDLTTAEHVYVTLEQNGGSLTITDLSVEPQAVSFTLSQEDSLSLPVGPMNCQINWVFADGTRGATKLRTLTIQRNLIEKVLP